MNSLELHSLESNSNAIDSSKMLKPQLSSGKYKSPLSFQCIHRKGSDRPFPVTRYKPSEEDSTVTFYFHGDSALSNEEYRELNHLIIHEL